MNHKSIRVVADFHRHKDAKNHESGRDGYKKVASHNGWGMLAEHQPEIQAERDRKLEAAREQRKNCPHRIACLEKRIASGWPPPLKQFEQRMIRDLLEGLGKCAQILPEALGIAIMMECFNFQMCTLPNWNGADKQAPPFCR
jgi:hypothetical protein